MSSRAKTILINCMVGLTIMLFIIGFYIGKDIEAKEEKEEIERQKEEAYTEEFSPSNSNDIKEVSEEEHEDYEYDDPEVDKEDEPTQKSKTLSDFFSKKDIEDSKKVAQSFIEAYYPFNGDNPLENIENAKEYMAKRLYEDYRGSIARPTQSVYKKEIKSIDVYEPYDPSSNYVEWNVRVIGETFDSKGNLNKEETYDYSLKLTKENEKFIVQEFNLNLTN